MDWSGRRNDCQVGWNCPSATGSALVLTMTVGVALVRICASTVEAVAMGMPSIA